MKANTIRLQSPQNTASYSPKRSGVHSALRTGATVAGGVGLAYGGLKLGRAAGEIRGVVARLAPALERTAGNAVAVSETVRSPLKALRQKLGFSVGRSKSGARKQSLEFAHGATVAADRYRKQIYEQEQDRATSNYTKSALAGAAAGALLRRGKLTRGSAAAAGGLVGVAAQAGIRSATAGTKDAFGDRSHGAKKAEKLPWKVGGLVAAGLAYRKLGGKVGFSSLGKRVREFAVAENMSAGAMDKVRKVLSSPKAKLAFLHGAALTGGIGIADAVTSGATAKPGDAVAATGEGLGRGLLYGGVLAAAEPALVGAGKKLLRRAFSARLRAIEFGGIQQGRTEQGRFIQPLSVESGLPAVHGQTIRAALNKGRDIQRAGARAGSLVKDASDALTGREKLDVRGRPRKREWEKSWFKNTMQTAAVGAGLLAHAHVMRTNPAYRASVAKLVRKSKGTANSLVPDLFPMSAKRREVRFDSAAEDAGWDVRDPRGKSARVFAPGSAVRQRREKYWHEKVDNIRRIAVGGALVATAVGAGAGYKIGRRTLTASRLVTKPSNIIPMVKAG